MSIHAASAVPTKLASGFQLFLQIPEIKGESTVKGYEGQIEVAGFSWGAYNSGSFQTGGGGGAGKANVQDLAITKYFDSSSPKLFAAVLTGQHLKNAALHVVQSTVDGSKLELMTLELNEVMISSAQLGAIAVDPGTRMQESITITFASLKLTHGPSGGSASWSAGPN